MADDRHYVPGDYYRICERTGFKVRAGHTKKEWTNRIVRETSFELRQPQDFVTGVRDDQTVFEPRTRQVDSFQGPLGTKLSQNYVLTSSPIQYIFVESSVRMFINDVLYVMCDNNEMCKCIIVDVPTIPGKVQIDRMLSYKASAGNIVIDYSAESDPVLYEGQSGTRAGSGVY